MWVICSLPWLCRVNACLAFFTQTVVWQAVTECAWLETSLSGGCNPPECTLKFRVTPYSPVPSAGEGRKCSLKGLVLSPISFSRPFSMSLTCDMSLKEAIWISSLCERPLSSSVAISHIVALRLTYLLFPKLHQSRKTREPGLQHHSVWNINADDSLRLQCQSPLQMPSPL